MASWFRRSKPADPGGPATPAARPEPTVPPLPPVAVAHRIPTRDAGGSPSRPADDALAEDLMRRVGTAIEDWATANDLRSVPRHIIFEQAMSILNAMDRSMTRPGSERR